MTYMAKSIRSFIGAKEFGRSRAFYKDLGFEEVNLSDTLSLFKMADLSFYLQDYYVKEWADNTMLLLEVDNAAAYWQHLSGLNLQEKYPEIKIMPLQQNDWGEECQLIDPAGVLWHFATFTTL